ncbi:MAG: hypothetical protein HFI12_08505 [Lachnospiraceae bacterium]|jgi:hypothetical protein|nr:hypothetical protein [Lachnospiraceae bacterium]
MRKQRALPYLLSSLVAFSFAIPAQAETYYGDENWKVAFTSEDKMESSFSTADINDVIGGMQPGDNVIITLNLKNENRTTTDWYMRNEVLYSLEDRSTNKETSGGAYTYRLVYTDKDGEVNTLFDSDTVGGESADDTINRMGEGLKSATNALKDYFYLDTLAKGAGGVVTLEVALDGETQGNHYQDTLADLQMDFAVELRDTPEGGGGGGGGTPDTPGTPNTPDTPGSTTSRTGVVRTGDDNQIVLFSVISGVTGLLLLLYCIYNLRAYRKRREEA